MEIKITNQKKAYFCAVLYALIIGFSFLFVKMTLTVADPLTILAHRFTVSFLAASIPVLLGWIKLKVCWKDVLSILPPSLFYPTLFFGFQVFGLVHITSSEAGIIQASVPIFTMILAVVFLKEKSDRLQKLSLILSVCGVIYIFAMKGISFESANFLGVLLICLSALASASYNVLAKRVTKKHNLLDLTYIMTFMGFFSFNLLSVIDHGIHGTLGSYFSPFLSPLFVASILYLGVLSSLITALLSNYVLSQIDACKMSVFSNLSTLITMLAGVVFLQERLQYFHLIGAAMILAGIVGTNFLGGKHV